VPGDFVGDGPAPFGTVRVDGGRAMGGGVGNVGYGYPRGRPTKSTIFQCDPNAKQR
jgi:hypothetical protein